MPKSILIIGEDPAQIDFDAPDAPKDMTGDKVMEGLNDSVARLKGAGHRVTLLLTKDAATVERQTMEALSRAIYDVIVIGAGLRTLPQMAEQFERLMNVLHEGAPRALNSPSIASQEFRPGSDAMERRPNGGTLDFHHNQPAALFPARAPRFSVLILGKRGTSLAKVPVLSASSSRMSPFVRRTELRYIDDAVPRRM
ncbi:hypothetical protein FHX15_005889 [Rhizobium sp. BK650]|uniref:hypothetical protein n=1 Tax=Rhizobium sp. BK650 TaxID=2586990 RepID=UPI00161CCFA5|nr:hypothetical protein [Rhizobium sp. BK650]MBB3660618.1 hypothetical protein [Rhizobium sp. BK650]